MPASDPDTVEQGPRSWIHAAVRLGLLAGLWLPSGCVIPPDPLPQSVGGDPLIHIVKSLVDPILDGTQVVSRGELAIFDVRKAVESRDTTGVLNYAWYGDVDDKSGIPLQFYKACDNSQLCILNACKGFVNGEEADEHKLLLVVSDATLAADATSPFGFPTGVAFDWVEWQVELHGECLK